MEHTCDELSVAVFAHQDHHSLAAMAEGQEE
jgi:hypothetical protein